MSCRYARFWQLLVSLALLGGSASVAHALSWSDDFNDGNISDGNPVSWQTNPGGFFPGTYDASSGDFAMSAPGDTNGDSDPAGEILVSWVHTPDDFSDVYVRGQGIIMPGALPEEEGGNLVLLGRLQPEFLNTYVLYLDSGGSLVLQISQGGTLTDLAGVELEGLTGLDEVVMELNIVGDQLSGYAWPAGGSKPATPQVTVTNGVFTFGKAGLAYAEDDDNTIGVYRWAMAQDVPFVDALPGDFNNDGKVDAADYVVWRKGEQGGTFDQDDYNAWRMNFGAPAGAGNGSLAGAAVPEPGVVIQLVAAIAAFLASAGRRRSILG
jgi:hypothetical protein